jgi:FixJ family two-component response regulator
MTAPAPTVFVVDDDPVLLFFLRGILLEVGHRVETFEQPEALIARLSARDRGCVVLDLRMPALSGLEVQQALAARGVRLPLIFVSGRADVPAVVAAIKGGAVDFLAKPIEPGDLRAVVDRALRWDAEIAAVSEAREQDRARWATLSPREREVCRRFARGLSDKQIAADLGTAAGTVQAQRASALRKLRVASAVEVARLLANVGDEG